MEDRDLQLRLLRQVSMEKVAAWGFGARSGAPAPQLPMLNKDMSEAPAGGTAPVGGTTADLLQGRAAQKMQAVQENLAEKTLPLKTPPPPAVVASAPTVRNRNDRMARQVTQPPGKAVVASADPKMLGLGSLVVNQDMESLKTLGLKKQAVLGLASWEDLKKGNFTDPVTYLSNTAPGQKFERAMTNTFGQAPRDPLTWTRQEVVNPALGAVGRALDYKLPGGETPGRLIQDIGYALPPTMPVVQPVLQGLRGMSAYGRGAVSAAGMAAKSQAGRAVGAMDDFAAAATRGMGPELAYAGAGAPAEARAAASIPKPPGTGNLQMAAQGPRSSGMRAARPSGGGGGTNAPTPAPTPAAEVATEAAEPLKFGPSKPRPPQPASQGRVVETAETAAKTTKKAPTPRPIPTEPAELRQTLTSLDPLGRGPGMDATVPQMQDLLQRLGYPTMGRANLAARNLSSKVTAPLFRQPAALPRDLAEAEGVTGALQRAGYYGAREIPFVGPRIGGPGFFVSPSTGQYSLLSAPLTRAAVKVPAATLLFNRLAPQGLQDRAGAVVDLARARLTGQPPPASAQAALRGKSSSEFANEKIRTQTPVQAAQTRAGMTATRNRLLNDRYGLGLPEDATLGTVNATLRGQGLPPVGFE